MHPAILSNEALHENKTTIRDNLMFKNNIPQFNDLCPLVAAKDFIRARLIDLSSYKKSVEKIDSDDFTQLELDFLAGCFIAYNDYSFEFLMDYDEDLCDIHKSIVSFMVSPTNYSQKEFLLLMHIKRICVTHYLPKINDLIEYLKDEVAPEITDSLGGEA